MLTLSLLWLALGALLGAAAVLARWTPRRWSGFSTRRRWLAGVALGAGAALLGGWLVGLLFDHLFATLVAVWVCIAVLGAAGRPAPARR